jgi:hypothetical protein
MPGVAADVLVQVEHAFIATDAKVETRRAIRYSPTPFDCLHVITFAMPSKCLGEISKALFLHFDRLGAARAGPGNHGFRFSMSQ